MNDFYINIKYNLFIFVYLSGDLHYEIAIRQRRTNRNEDHGVRPLADGLKKQIIYM